VNTNTNVSGYDISNDYETLKIALNYYKTLEKEFLEYVYVKHKKSIAFKIEKYIFRMTVDNINIINYPSYYFKMKYKGYSHFKIVCAISDIEQWVTAIERNNKFTISSVSYSKFLKYVKESVEI
jgi:hypothetical protein